MIDDADQAKTLDDALTLFETVGIPAQTFSERTRVVYLGDLRDLTAFLNERRTSRPVEVSRRNLANNQAEMDRRGY